MCGGGPMCAAVVLCVRRSSVFGGVRCLLPFIFGEFGVSERHPPAGVNDTWYNMRRRIVTFISCVHLPAFLSVTFVCTNASKINVTRKMVPITGRASS